MMPKVQNAIEQLYTVFAKYPLRYDMPMCSCGCISNEDKRLLFSKPLRDLTGEELGKYSFKAVTTWGDVEDLKHFLPRIIELFITTNDLYVCLLSKLGYVEWLYWGQREVEAVENALLAWWQHCIFCRPYFSSELFLDLLEHYGEVDKLLEIWIISFEDGSFVSFVDFLEYEYYTLLNNEKIKAEDVQKIKDWVAANKHFLEEGFFYFEDKDVDFAGNISDALFALEHYISY